MKPPFPLWTYQPLNVEPPPWVLEFIGVVAAAEAEISTVDDRAVNLTSDGVLKAMADGLEELGFQVERGKARAQKIFRPVLFGENGKAALQYEIDGYHDGLGIVLEVEAGRGARGNAAFRDLLRTSLILDARNLALLLPASYAYGQQSRTVVQAYRECRDFLNAVYASQRLRLPFEGVLLVGY